MKYKYNPLENNFYTVYESSKVDPTSIQLPLMDSPVDISPWGWNDNGIIKAKDKLGTNNGGNKSGNESLSTMVVNNTEEYPISQQEALVQEEPIQERETTGKKAAKNGTVKRADDMELNFSRNKEQAMNYFQNKGLKPHQAAGLVGNLIRESRLDPEAKNPSSGAMGLAQWLGDRKKKLVKKYGNNPTFEQQLDFVWEELNSTHRKGLEYLKKSKTAEEAAVNAFGWFEFSTGPAGAVAEMNKHGQDGRRSFNEGIRWAKSLLK